MAAYKFYSGVNIQTDSLLSLYNSADTHFVSLKCPSGQSADFNLVLPGSDAASGVLQSDGSGNLSIATLVNTNVSATAAIAATKLAVLAAGSISSISTNTNLVSQTVYLVNTSGGAVTVTLPAPATSVYITVKDSGGSAETNNITIARHSTETIDGAAASYLLNFNYGSVDLISDGTNWFII